MNGWPLDFSSATSGRQARMEGGKANVDVISSFQPMDEIVSYREIMIEDVAFIAEITD